jgi:hypothetical protein
MFWFFCRFFILRCFLFLLSLSPNGMITKHQTPLQHSTKTKNILTSSKCNIFQDCHDFLPSPYHTVWGIRCRSCLPEGIWSSALLAMTGTTIRWCVTEEVTPFVLTSQDRISFITGTYLASGVNYWSKNINPFLPSPIQMHKPGCACSVLVTSSSYSFLLIEWYSMHIDAVGCHWGPVLPTLTRIESLWPGRFPYSFQMNQGLF